QIDSALGEYFRKRFASATTPSTQRQRGLKTSTIVWARSYIKLPTLRQRLGLVYGTQTELFSTEIALLRQIIAKANTRVRLWNGKLYFIYLPGWSTYSNVPIPNETSAVTQRATILRLVRELEIPLVDMHVAFEAHGDPLSLFP